MLSPSGRFEVGVKICLSMSSYHPEHWQPSWSVRSALVALIAFMPTAGKGAIGSVVSSHCRVEGLTGLAESLHNLWGSWQLKGSPCVRALPCSSGQLGGVRPPAGSPQQGRHWLLQSRTLLYSVATCARACIAIWEEDFVCLWESQGRSAGKAAFNQLARAASAASRVHLDLMQPGPGAAQQVQDWEVCSIPSTHIRTALSLPAPAASLHSTLQSFYILHVSVLATLQDFPDAERRAMARASRATVPKHGSPARQAITQKVHEAMLAAEAAGAGPQVGSVGLDHPVGGGWLPLACSAGHRGMRDSCRCKQHLPADHLHWDHASPVFQMSGLTDA